MFPEVQKQVHILIRVLASVAALNALIAMFLLIFCLMGMNLFAGKMTTAELEPALGAYCYVMLPSDPAKVQRYGRIIGTDFENHTTVPWKVQIRYGILCFCMYVCVYVYKNIVQDTCGFFILKTCFNYLSVYMYMHTSVGTDCSIIQHS